MRKVFVDCGANLGIVLNRFIHELPDHDFYAFEPNKDLHPSIHQQVAQAFYSPRVKISQSAVWTHDGTIDLFLGHHESSTVMPGKRVPPVYDRQIDYSSPVPVPATDFSSWLRRTVTADDHVVVKMDIEGAEYPVLSKLLADGTINLVSVLYIEWHYDRFPAMSRADHDQVANAVSACVEVREWD
ncbi:Methyltransferase FkbM domain protein [Streptomyces griseofuscus]|uniref:Methyltransferase FkbM domain protein n=1 Tax=Streptomyces griseofuscus TaxID=146922 RepID=A0A7H1PWE2_9ACTN|nr:FkbM family methyltransferase [Streptomyces griseofuscus]QNT92372.1 Methyltransferase FkbM domain protein [Streptomyces griseofuscus]